MEFDASKESKHVLATCGRGSGGPFTFLGVSFDEGLTMAGALHSLVHEASWKLASILRTSRYFSTPELIGLYKSKLLSYIEYRTPAIYHACTSHLAPLDQIQRRFLREIGMSEIEALTLFKLAPWKYGEILPCSA